MKKDKERTLTKAEMQVMNILWSMGKAADVHEVVARYDEPRPAYTTVSTFLKILSTKGFVDFKKGDGKQYLYFPVVHEPRHEGGEGQFLRRKCLEVCPVLYGGGPTERV